MYIGQTGRCLKQRVSEHRRALKNEDVQASALAEHVLKTGHAVDLSQSEVLDHHQHTTTCCMLESWYIQHNQAALNRSEEPYQKCTRRSWTDAWACTYFNQSIIIIILFLFQPYSYIPSSLAVTSSPVTVPYL